MRIKDNPFYVLGVKPEDSIATIYEAAEDKIFLDEDNRRKYEDARSMLSVAGKRIAAELRWFYEYSGSVEAVLQSNAFRWEKTCGGETESMVMAMEYLHQAQEEYFNAWDKDYQTAVDQAAEAIKCLDKSWLAIEEWNKEYEAFDDDYYAFDDDYYAWENLIDNINNARAKAGISAIEDFGEIKEQLQGLLEDAKIALRSFLSLKNNEIDDLAKVVNKVAADVLESGAEYSEIIEDMISCYNLAVKSTLLSKKERAEKAIENAEDYTSTRQLIQLKAAVRSFDWYAQPLQLYYLRIGKSDQQKESSEIADQLLQLALHYATDAKPALATEILNLVADSFRELREAKETAEEAKKVVHQVSSEKVFFDLVTSVNESFIRKVGHEEENKQIIQAKKEQWLSAIDIFVKGIEANPSEDKQERYGALAYLCITIASGCTWVDCWQESWEFFAKGKNFAMLSGNAKIIAEFKDKEADYKKYQERGDSINVEIEQTFYALFKAVSKIVRKQGYAEANRKIILANKAQWLQDIGIVAGKIYIANHLNQREKYGDLARVCLAIAAACTWGECWQESWEFFLKGQSYAHDSQNLKLIIEFADKEGQYRYNANASSSYGSETGTGCAICALLILGFIIFLSFR